MVERREVYVTIAALAEQLGTTTDKLLTACRVLGFDLGGGWSLINVDTFNEAIAAKKAEFAGASEAVEDEEPYFSEASYAAMVAETNQALATRTRAPHARFGRIGLAGPMRRRAS